jgi:hypothetical protein
VIEEPIGSPNCYARAGDRPSRDSTPALAAEGVTPQNSERPSLSRRQSSSEGSGPQGRLWLLALVLLVPVLLLTGVAGGYVYGHKDLPPARDRATRIQHQRAHLHRDLGSTRTDLSVAQTDGTTPLDDADISRYATEALSRMMAKTTRAAQAADRADYLTSGTLLIEVEVMQSAVGQGQITCIWSADNSS